METERNDEVGITKCESNKSLRKNKSTKNLTSKAIRSINQQNIIASNIESEIN